MGIRPFEEGHLNAMIPHYENFLPTQRSEITPNETISFSESSVTCCVGIVDIVNSTKITSRLSSSKIAKYYGAFLNTMGFIIKRYGGVVVKNVGDSILFYFPESISTDSESTRPIECGLTMTSYHDAISRKLQSMGLPQLDYRISLDYGTVVLASSSTSTCEDIFGPTVNMCAKINHSAKPNTVVIGGDLHSLVKESGYRFEKVQECVIGLKHQYPVYAISAPLHDTKKIVTTMIERTLLEISPEVLEVVINRLDKDFNYELSDCHDCPEPLKTVLRDIFGVSHTEILKSIVSKLESYPYQRPVINFIEKLD